MIALITQREQKDSHGTPIDAMESDYIKYFEGLGIKLYPISNFITDIRSCFEIFHVDFVILTGGGSVPNKYYRCPAKEPQQENRDRVEKALIDECLERQIPILGICRGMQFLNGYFGGKVEKLFDLQFPRQNGKDHLVYSELLRKSFVVNNYHNDGIKLDGLADGLKVFAIDMDNEVVEAFYSKDKKILALQWHPERSFESLEAKEQSRSILGDFINIIAKE